MRRELRASYTVEAAVILPIALFVTVIVIQLGIEKYTELAGEFGRIDICAQTKGAETVYRLEASEDVWEELKWK